MPVCKIVHRIRRIGSESQFLQGDIKMSAVLQIVAGDFIFERLLFRPARQHAVCTSLFQFLHQKAELSS
jgi:hypothetical protein